MNDDEFEEKVQKYADKLPLPHIEPAIATLQQTGALINYTGKDFSFIVDSRTEDGKLHLTLIYRRRSYALLSPQINAILES